MYKCKYAYSVGVVHPFGVITEAVRKHDFIVIKIRKGINNMKKRLLSMLLALTMVLSLVSAMGITASAETAQPYLTFLSQSEFQLGTYDDSCNNWTKNTGSYLEYTTTPEKVESWMVWDGATAINSAKAGETYYLYLRGKMTTGSMSWFDEGDPNDPEDDG